MRFDEKAMREVTRWLSSMHKGVIAEAVRIARESRRTDVTFDDVDSAIARCMAGMAEGDGFLAPVVSPEEFALKLCVTKHPLPNCINCSRVAQGIKAERDRAANLERKL
jgi:hypothetical protein